MTSSSASLPRRIAETSAARGKTIALSKVEAWKRGEEFPKEFVPLPGETYPNSVLVDGCSTLLLAPKSAALN